jgi:SAM-dependent methyltransferase
MKNQSISVYEDIDWQLLWQQSRSRKSWKSKDAKEWSKKGKSFAGRVRESAFIDLFLKHIVLDQNMSILDIGCGPGTLAVPIARQVKRVTAIDYSEGMIELLRQEAGRQQVENIDAFTCAWEDNWSDFGITRHDIAIASRSMNIADLRSGLEKLNSYAAAKVYIVERIAPSPFDPDAFAAIGRPFNSGPDYIYTLNMLYTLGIHPHIEHIELNREQRFASIDRAMQNYRWMFKELTAEEERRLEKFLWKQIVRQETDHIIIKRNHPQRWVVISWTPEQID